MTTPRERAKAWLAAQAKNMKDWDANRRAEMRASIGADADAKDEDDEDDDNEKEV